MKIHNGVIAFVLMSVVGCGSSGTESSASFAGTFAGNQSGTQNGTAFSQTVVFTLTQSGSAVGGNWSNNSGTSYGTVSGTASGASVSNLTVTQDPATGCSGSLTGSMAISGSKLSGNISGTLTTCGAVSAAFAATRQ